MVLYWNKQAFEKAGLDADTPPANWQQVVDFGKKLVVKDGQNVSQWGIEIPTTPNGYWVFQGFAATNGAHLDNGKGTAVYFNTPGNIETLQWLTDLGQKEGVSPKGAVAWGTTPQDFLSGKTAMMVTTTGNLSVVRKMRRSRLVSRCFLKRHSAEARPVAVICMSSKMHPRHSRKPPWRLSVGSPP